MKSDLIKITKNSVLSPLPDPFLFDDGTRVKTKADWAKKREELLRVAVELPYGDRIPAPEYLRVDPLDIDGVHQTYRITAGPTDCPVSFTCRVFLPSAPKNKPFPIVIDGDMSWRYCFDKEWLNAFLSRGIAVCMFYRCEIVSDIRSEGKRSPLYRAYPDLEFGALMAWAWGYSRCLDAMLSLGLADEKRVTFCGHSRGGKTALLAGVLDERASIVSANNSGCGGCGCYRNNILGITEDGEEKCNESLEAIIDQFDYWFSKKLLAYYGRAGELPCDAHELKALIAPRILFEGNAASDIWANPVGSFQTTIAATEVYKFLGVPQNHLWYYRNGYHAHKVEDVERLARFIAGESEADEYFVTPFEIPAPLFDWSAPEAE